MALALAAGATLGALAQSPASYPGGEEALQAYIQENLVYPQAAKDNGIEGVVTLECTILPDGSVGPIKVKRMVDPDLEQEAIRLVKAITAWTPATDAAGKAVLSVVQIPVTFSLGD